MLNFLIPDVFVSSVPFDNCFDLTKGHVDKGMLDQASQVVCTPQHANTREVVKARELRRRGHGSHAFIFTSRRSAR
jgi:hypothetical protein